MLRWENGAVERLSILPPGTSATLIGHTGRTFTLAREGQEEKKKRP